MKKQWLIDQILEAVTTCELYSIGYDVNVDALSEQSLATLEETADTIIWVLDKAAEQGLY